MQQLQLTKYLEQAIEGWTKDPKQFPQGKSYIQINQARVVQTINRISEQNLALKLRIKQSDQRLKQLQKMVLAVVNNRYRMSVDSTQFIKLQPSQPIDVMKDLFWKVFYLERGLMPSQMEQNLQQALEHMTTKIQTLSEQKSHCQEQVARLVERKSFSPYKNIGSRQFNQHCQELSTRLINEQKNMKFNQILKNVLNSKSYAELKKILLKYDEKDAKQLYQMINMFDTWIHTPYDLQTTRNSLDQFAVQLEQKQLDFDKLKKNIQKQKIKEIRISLNRILKVFESNVIKNKDNQLTNLKGFLENIILPDKRPIARNYLQKINLYNQQLSKIFSKFQDFENLRTIIERTTFTQVNQKRMQQMLQSITSMSDQNMRKNIEIFLKLRYRQYLTLQILDHHFDRNELKEKEVNQYINEIATSNLKLANNLKKCRGIIKIRDECLQEGLSVLNLAGFNIVKDSMKEQTGLRQCLSAIKSRVTLAGLAVSNRYEESVPILIKHMSTLNSTFSRHIRNKIPQPVYQYNNGKLQQAVDLFLESLKEVNDKLNLLKKFLCKEKGKGYNQTSGSIDEIIKECLQIVGVDITGELSKNPESEQFVKIKSNLLSYRHPGTLNCQQAKGYFNEKVKTTQQQQFGESIQSLRMQLQRSLQDKIKLENQLKEKDRTIEEIKSKSIVKAQNQSFLGKVTNLNGWLIDPRNESSLKVSSSEKQFQKLKQDHQKEKRQLQKEKSRFEKEIEKLKIEGIQKDKQVQREINNTKAVFQKDKAEYLKKIEQYNSAVHNQRAGRVELEQKIQQINQKIQQNLLITQKKSSRIQILEEERSKIDTLLVKSQAQIQGYAKQNQELRMQREYRRCLSDSQIIDLNPLKFSQTEFIISHIKIILQRQIRETKLLYKYSEKTKSVYHKYIDGHRNLLLILETATGQIIAVFSQKPLSKSENNQKGKGLLFSVDMRETYHLKEGKSAIMYSQHQLVFGDGQLRIDPEDKTLQSRFGQKGLNFDYRGHGINSFFGQGQQKGKIPIKSLQCYQVCVQEQEPSIRDTFQTSLITQVPGRKQINSTSIISSKQNTQNSDTHIAQLKGLLKKKEGEIQYLVGKLGVYEKETLQLKELNTELRIQIQYGRTIQFLRRQELLQYKKFSTSEVVKLKMEIQRERQFMQQIQTELNKKLKQEKSRKEQLLTELAEQTKKREHAEAKSSTSSDETKHSDNILQIQKQRKTNQQTRQKLNETDEKLAQSIEKYQVSEREVQRLTEERQQIRAVESELRRSLEEMNQKLLKMERAALVQEQQVQCSRIERERYFQTQIQLLRINEGGRSVKHFFAQDILYQNQEKREWLVNLIEEQNQRKIARTKFLRKMDTECKDVNLHIYIDDHPNICMVIKTTKGYLLGAFSATGFKVKGASDMAFLFSLTNCKHFSANRMNPKYKPLVYDDYFVIFGNSELRIKSGRNDLFSNFAIQENYFEKKINGKLQNVNILLGQGEGVKNATIQAFEFYEIQFTDT